MAQALAEPGIAVTKLNSQLVVGADRSGSDPATPGPVRVGPTKPHALMLVVDEAP